jgi:hypothetical protein
MLSKMDAIEKLRAWSHRALVKRIVEIAGSQRLYSCRQTFIAQKLVQQRKLNEFGESEGLQ